ncbi:pantoate--beta-alanine ligase [Streptomyces avicenniae]|uniref:pantoate--beta-alanine ligase n=1 Tax=Streptomyces avicenniae TaxID=500153 RepID=UPI00069A1B0C|nr:pantoate--beta-alanine ligase [Streptomyces avicenniae]
MTISVARDADALRALYTPGADRAVVMTMGALHEGHLANMRAARQRLSPAGQLVVTVYVNPLQFGPGEDFDRYPRQLDADVKLAEEGGADLVFAPDDATMYPDGHPRVTLTAGPMGAGFEGAERPGHFDGMLTVVAKLLHLTAPDYATFGEKDAQQLALVRRMVRDLDFPVEILPVPTLRDDDGLARSSRNRYLTPAGRTTALALSRALFTARDTTGPPAARLAAARAVLDAAAGAEPPLALGYLALIDPADFTEIDGGDTAFTGEAVLAVAARVGTTRLIDNVRLTLGAAA